MHHRADGKGDVLSIEMLVKRSHDTAVNKGWWESERGVPECLALIHSEVSEALEAYRNQEPEGKEDGKPVGFGSELADILIRVADLAGKLEINLEQIVHDKLEYNALRPHRHGGKLA
jgi:NTP pyrophosphatase (non-canonical NTP hydrolase)